MSDKLLLQKLGALCGFMVPIVAFGCIGMAILSFPEFSWINNALSDLGVVAGVTGVVFNFGLFVAGLLCFFFAVVGLFNYFKNSAVGKLGSVVFAVAAVCLMNIGVFNENFWSVHFVFAVLFFVTLPVAFCVLAVVLYLVREINLAVFTLGSMVGVAMPWIVYFLMVSTSNVAVPEFISSVVGSIWIAFMSYKLLKPTRL
ncbi:MAG: DUF998 domain-containing protein [Nitrososphaerota archaeon]|jgi:hypothetical membrane protein|nr:DUF998 domain-containing protein [Nitrososphaerota archaeon]